MALEYFTEAELRALPPMSDEVTYTDARIDAASVYVVKRFEEFCGVSFISRSHTETKDGTRANETGRGIVLTQRKPIAVTALTQDGTAFTAPELLELKVRGGVVRRFATGAVIPDPWNDGWSNIVVTYTAGYVNVPGDIKEAALQATKARLLSTNSDAEIDDRRISINTEVGSFNLAIAGADRPMGYPEVDAVLLDYKRGRAPLVF